MNVEDTSGLSGYFRYWGKAKAEADAPEPYHLLPYHSLDVAAVGRSLLQQHPVLTSRLSSLIGMAPADFARWAVALLALHDLGKFAVTFQNLRPDLFKSMQRRTTDKQSERHDSLGYLLWQELIRPAWQAQGLLPKTGPRCRVQPNTIQAANAWMAAMTGHHGTPPKSVGQPLSDPFEADDQQAASDYVADVLKLLLDDQPRFPNLDLAAANEASWWLAGFAVLCDWIGSNSNHFPYRSKQQSLQEYWNTTRTQADAAIAETELLPKQPAHALSLQTLINSTGPINSTPLQAQAAGLPLGDGPQLFILEDVTGAGKTEAALLLAQRLMTEGHAHGLYFGLPTMATANAMYERLSGHGYRQLFQAEQQPSLVLAHGAAHLSDAFRQSIVGSAGMPDDNYEDQPAAAAHCSQWLSDNRKKALLADVGIGTLDQALLAILPSRHQSLRLLGLIGKVLIIDEVHACDAYMHPLLCRLLRAHAAAGGTAILLSATLPQRQRDELAASFAQGIGAPTPELTSNDYPLLTQVGEHKAIELAIDTRESVRRHVAVQCVQSTDAVESLIADAVAKDQCVCWIRNTVGDAREAYQRLYETHPDWQIDLFHARFALADRLDIEQRVLDTYGKNSDHDKRKGRVLIATQVVEQSLDIDFDHLISDLAPIDLIIQRAGRLRRHRRDALGNPHDQPDQRGQPLLHLHIPEWADEPSDDWFEKAFRRAAWVYPDHGQLWLGAKLLRQQGGFRMPEDARGLIEGVYGEEAEIPEGLQRRSNEAEGEAKAKASVAMLNGLNIGSGYTRKGTNDWWDDTQTPTRLGDKTTTIWLAQWDGNQLRPWRDDLDFPWHQSSLSLRGEFTNEEAETHNIPQQAIDDCMKQLPAAGKWGVLLPLRQTEKGIWSGLLRHQQAGLKTYEYQSVTGLLEKESG